MPEVLALAYSIGWVLTAIATYIASRHFRAKGSPADHPLLVCLVAGAVWPLALLGVVEIGVVAAARKAARRVKERSDETGLTPSPGHLSTAREPGSG
jgi:hypothetical protein